MRASDHRAGACSILTGVAASRSILAGHPVRIDDIVSGLQSPRMPAMPVSDAPLEEPAPQASSQSAGRDGLQAIAVNGGGGHTHSD
ncbi:MAG: hypothetical protein GVY16_03155 [Planctomycetes bacterium]|jgi:hypothetical protein|nr:hypothetical protein [Phycisphaerae bacterium]NBB94717.1 hypothetical protein [Planctomycetota bacterium]